MFEAPPIELDWNSSPFEHFSGVRRLASARSGHASGQHARHQLYLARDRRTRTNVVIKVTSKPGVVYEQDLLNEIATLTTINRELADSRYFPILGDHGRLRDGRIFLTMSCFDEWPLATAISAERLPARLVAHLRTAIEVARALSELHSVPIWHVDLNPMNIMARWQSGKPVIRLVDFESSYEVARHSAGVFYNPPTTSGYSAPELLRQSPDGTADVFSAGAVLYTLLAGFGWTWSNAVADAIARDPDVSGDLKGILLTAVDPEPANRYQSIGEWRDTLSAHLEQIWPGRSW